MSEKQTYLRFDLAQRIEHIALILSFTTLAVTGLIQKFATAGVSIWLINLLGGITATRILHRGASIVLILLTVYHFVVVGYKLIVLRRRSTMAPSVKDARDALQAFLYNFGLAKEPPRMGRYNFIEKAEYWAMIWGTLLMGLTGFMLWNPIATASALPGQFIPAAKAAHGAEAILAVLAIFVWHFYHVHLKRWNWSMINGRLSREEMEEDHALELEEIESGQPAAEIAPQTLRRRRAVYLPAAGLLSLGLLALIFWFLTSQKTAIAPLPAPERTPPVFAPITATPPAAALSWEGEIGGMFETKCKVCHGAAGGVNLSSYAVAMKNGSGALIFPGDAGNSPLVIHQSQNGHPGQFDPEELAAIKEWIEGGAPRE